MKKIISLMLVGGCMFSGLAFSEEVKKETLSEKCSKIENQQLLRCKVFDKSRDLYVKGKEKAKEIKDKQEQKKKESESRK